MNYKYNLMIVESPPKAKKINQILRSANLNFKVVATRGYLVDIPKDSYGLDFNENVEVKVKWKYLEGKQKLISEFKRLADDAETVYIATDGDREGEKIAKDIVEKLKLKDYYRIDFNSIEKDAILESMQTPSKVHLEKAKVSIARRVIDRDIGYPVSEMLRFSLEESGIVIPNNLGCGRSISPTLHILNEKQKEVDAFVKETYLRAKVWYQKEGVGFEGIHKTRFMTNSRENMLQFDMLLGQMRDSAHTVVRYTPKTVDVPPPEPLYTATLFQSSFNLYKFKSKETEKYAQLLQQMGYITYTRTDSNEISKKGYLRILKYLSETQDADDVQETKRGYKKRKNSQDGHEAIRPVEFEEIYHPDNIINTWKERGEYIVDKDETNKKNYNKFTEKHQLVYELIWYRALATQMIDTVYDRSEVVIDIENNEIVLNANVIEEKYLADGTTKKMRGWLGLKESLLAKSVKVDDFEFLQDEVRLPEFYEGEILSVISVEPRESSTTKPHHYGEGRLIKKIDTEGIARPSGLHNILPSLLNKKCIDYVGGTVRITKMGVIVDEWISEHAPWLNDLEQGKLFEDTLDLLADGIEEEFTTNSLIRDYHERIELLKEDIGYLEMDKREPFEWQLEKAYKIAKEKDIKLGEEVLKTRASIEVFISNNSIAKNIEYLGKCPSCKKGSISENSKAFGCNKWKDGCKFSLWKNDIEKFFTIFDVIVTPEYVSNIIIAALRKKPILHRGFKSKKNESFDACIGIKYNEEYKKWQFDLELNKKKIEKAKEQEEQSTVELVSNFNEHLGELLTLPNDEDFKDRVKKSFNIEGSNSMCLALLKFSNMQVLEKALIFRVFNELTSHARKFNSSCYLNYNEEKIYIQSFQRNESEFKKAILSIINLVNTEMFGGGANGVQILAFKKNSKNSTELIQCLENKISEMNGLTGLDNMILIGRYE